MALLPQLRYHEHEAVAMRLHGTMCLYKGKAVYINAQTDKDGRPRRRDDLNVIACHNDSPYQEIEVHSSDEDLVVSGISIGYTNKNGKAIYCVRAPVRRTKQGLDQGSVLGFEVRGLGREQAIPCSRDFIVSKQFASMMENKYPPFDDAVKALGRDVVQMAFGRRLAVAQDELGLYKLHYCSQPVAFLGRKDRFIIPKRYEHYLPVIKRHNIELEIGD